MLQNIFPRRTWRSLGIFFALLGPGIITSNVDNDAGGITTYSLAGAEFGLSLLWTLIPITVVLIIIQEMCARMGVVSGKGLSDLIRERFGAKVTFYLMILLFLANLGNTWSEFAGVAASMEIFGVSKYISVPMAPYLSGGWWSRGHIKPWRKRFFLPVFFIYPTLFPVLWASPTGAPSGRRLLRPPLALITVFLPWL
jgi:Mn2+/Fe2+ NRAMP family transporter